MSAHKRFRRQIRAAIMNGQTDIEGIDLPKGMRTRHMKKAIAKARGLSTGVVSGRFVPPKRGAPEQRNGPEVSGGPGGSPDGIDGGSP